MSWVLYEVAQGVPKVPEPSQVLWGIGLLWLVLLNAGECCHVFLQVFAFCRAD